MFRNNISFFILALALNLNAEISINNLIITSEYVEISKDRNQVIFQDKVKIDSGTLVITANEAVYDGKKKIITVKGNPSLIDSLLKDLSFSGEASEIIFFANNKVQLVGKASMIYDDINISSNAITFNPQNGSISSND